jgi:hypothetical protein
MRTCMSIALGLLAVSALTWASAMPAHTAQPVQPALPVVEKDYPTWPFVVHTWPWTQAAEAACT